mmetsp:Transcript_11157/g.32960  ORF Transcript_11157/g.32960 Transcript_11157/m.32960 type:complete len:228 (+) Transcript_11157:422-1105(+)
MLRAPLAAHTRRARTPRSSPSEPSSPERSGRQSRRGTRRHSSVPMALRSSSPVAAAPAEAQRIRARRRRSTPVSEHAAAVLEEARRSCPEEHMQAARRVPGPCKALVPSAWVAAAVPAAAWHRAASASPTRCASDHRSEPSASRTAATSCPPALFGAGTPWTGRSLASRGPASGADTPAASSSAAGSTFGSAQAPAASPAGRSDTSTASSGPPLPGRCSRSAAFAAT